MGRPRYGRARIRTYAPGTFRARREVGSAGDVELAGLGWYRVRGEVVYRARRVLLLSQATLAERLGTAQVYVSYIEGDQAFLRLIDAERLARVLDELAVEWGFPAPGLHATDLLDPSLLPADSREARETLAVYPAPERLLA
jgi:transcriptional regulator with XRE-family HTH domain